MSYLNFVEQPLSNRKTKKWLVFSASAPTNPHHLAVISFYPQWRKYVAAFSGEAVFDASCLDEISNFLSNESASWRTSLKEKE